jgi:hypothetical protein
MDGDGVGVATALSVGPGFGLRFLGPSPAPLGDESAATLALGFASKAGVVAGTGGAGRGGMVRLGTS